MSRFTISGAGMHLYTDVLDPMVSVGSAAPSNIGTKPPHSSSWSLLNHPLLWNDGSHLALIATVTTGHCTKKYRYLYSFCWRETPLATFSDLPQNGFQFWDTSTMLALPGRPISGTADGEDKKGVLSGTNGVMESGKAVNQHGPDLSAYTSVDLCVIVS